MLVLPTFYKFLHHNCGGHCRMLTHISCTITCQHAHTCTHICIHICANILHILNIQFCISVLHVYILRASAQKEVSWHLGPTFKKAFPTFLGICVCCWEATPGRCTAFQCIFQSHTKQTVVRILSFFFRPERQGRVSTTCWMLQQCFRWAPRPRMIKTLLKGDLEVF